MFNYQLFTDGSVNTKLKIGYGACLLISNSLYDQNSIDELKDRVKVKRFEQTSSTKLELQTLLWALEQITPLINGENSSLAIYTDSQNILGLPQRRIRLEQNSYFSSKNKRFNNYELYQKFYQLTSKLNCKFVKVLGHLASRKKDRIDTIFNLVDKASRHALRKDFRGLNLHSS